MKTNAFQPYTFCRRQLINDIHFTDGDRLLLRRPQFLSRSMAASGTSPNPDEESLFHIGRTYYIKTTRWNGEWKVDLRQSRYFISYQEGYSSLSRGVGAAEGLRTESDRRDQRHMHGR